MGFRFDVVMLGNQATFFWWIGQDGPLHIYANRPSCHLDFKQCLEMKTVDIKVISICEPLYLIIIMWAALITPFGDVAGPVMIHHLVRPFAMSVCFKQLCVLRIGANSYLETI